MSNETRNAAPKTTPLFSTDAVHKSTATVSGDYTKLVDYDCSSVTIFTESKAIRVVQRSIGRANDSNTDYIVMPANQAFTFTGIVNAKELLIKADDDSVTTVRYRMEY
jgi:hypothetical protein